jgi:hypothetical protein
MDAARIMPGRTTCGWAVVIAIVVLVLWVVSEVVMRTVSTLRSLSSTILPLLAVSLFVSTLEQRAISEHNECSKPYWYEMDLGLRDPIRDGRWLV